MMRRDPAIDSYIAQAAPFAQPILTHLRGLIHGAVAGLDEALKWQMPHFVLGGKNLAGMAAFKAHAALVIHGDGRQGMAREGAMGQFGQLRGLADLPPDAELIARLRTAAERLAAGVRVVRARPQPRAELPVPPELVAALAGHPAAAAHFVGFAASARRDYCEWIGEAKRPETRANRIAQALEWIAEGKPRNWKYMK